jgi:predicted DsbA family dithiol-disulfide isomerase
MAPVHIALYADVACPFAYVTAFRLRRLRDEYRGRIVIEHKSLALEYVNREPTPMDTIEAEAQLLMLAEPAIPYQPWSRPDSEWPVTMWPAFEAVKCAESQGYELADELDWLVRRAFFAEHRCIALRHVLFALAVEAGLDMPRFADDFDSGRQKRQVLREAQAGWEELRVPGSPTFVLPSGEQIEGPALPEIELDPQRNNRLIGWTPTTCSGEACLDLYRAIFARAEAGVPSPAPSNARAASS